MHLLADHHAHRRSPEQPLPIGVPSRAPQQLTPSCRQAAEVGHLRTGHEADVRARGETKQLQDPPGSDLLGDRNRWRGDVHTAHLIPRGNHPVSTQRDRERAPDHEPEVARSSRGHEPGIGIGSQLLEHFHRVLPIIRQRPPQPHRIRAADVALAHSIQV